MFSRGQRDAARHGRCTRSSPIPPSHLHIRSRSNADSAREPARSSARGANRGRFTRTRAPTIFRANDTAGSPRQAVKYAPEVKAPSDTAALKPYALPRKPTMPILFYPVARKEWRLIPPTESRHRFPSSAPRNRALNESRTSRSFGPHRAARWRRNACSQPPPPIQRSTRLRSEPSPFGRRYPPRHGASSIRAALWQCANAVPRASEPFSPPRDPRNRARRYFSAIVGKTLAR